MEKKINLEEIINEEARKAGYSNFVHCFVEQDYTEEVTKQAMKEACRQVLELATENVGFIKTTTDELNSQDYTPFITAEDDTLWTFDKQSILNTINQVK